MEEIEPDKAQHELAFCRLIQGCGHFALGKQGLQYKVGVSFETVGAQHLHMQVLTIPPGGRAKAHKHVGHETAIYALTGTSHVWHGERLEMHSIVCPGNFFYIPPNVPHLPYNPSSTEQVVAVIARTDPRDQESVELLPELETIHMPDQH